MSERFYKFLKADGSSPYQKHKWIIPTNGKPSKWVSCKGKLAPCENGIHVCREQDLAYWLDAILVEVEIGKERVESDNKLVVRRCRVLRQVPEWNEQTQRLFAADCAERVLHLFESRYPDDERPRKAIEAARLFAARRITKSTLDAARAAAWAAAWDVARAAAWAAAWDVARDAARAAADTAAYAAASAAAGAAAAAAAAAAAWDAAWDAAVAAAWAAARAAARAAVGDAAYAAVGDAAYAAARAAAGDAEREWQTARLARLLEYLGEK